MAKTLIAIPCYNAAEFIRRTLDSCVSQTAKADILVVDNQSDDRTLEIAQEYESKYPFVNVRRNERNLGRVGNLNRCLEHFAEWDAQYLKFLFTGDELLPRCIEAVERVFAEHDGLSVVFWPYISDGRRPTVAHSHEESRLFAPGQIVEEGYFPSNLIGAIVQYTWSKRALQDSRFDDVFLGIATFANQVMMRGSAYYLNEVLSRYNLDGHRSHEKQFSYLYRLEVAYTKALSLEAYRSNLSRSDYERIRKKIVSEAIWTQRLYSEIDWSLLVKLAQFKLALRDRLSRATPRPAREIVRAVRGFTRWNRAAKEEVSP